VHSKLCKTWSWQAAEQPGVQKEFGKDSPGGNHFSDFLNKKQRGEEGGIYATLSTETLKGGGVKSYEFGHVWGLRMTSKRGRKRREKQNDLTRVVGREEDAI